MIVSRFEVRNRGGQELVIGQVRSSCSCGSLEREVNGGFEPLQELRLPPGGHAELVVRLVVRTDGPGTFKQTVSFATTDPVRPEAQIALVFRTASGGVRTHPNAVQFGRVYVGQEARQVVEVFDRDRSPQEVARVVSENPERVAVRWIPASSPERGDEGLLLGRIEVVANAARPRLLDGAVTVAFADPKIEPLTIMVSGRVAPRVEVTPESLVLPLSGGRSSLYTATCLVRGPEGQPLSLEIESASPGLTAEAPGAAGPVRTVRITWSPESKQAPGLLKKSVRVRVKTGEDSDVVEIPVTCEHKPRP